MAVLFLIIIIAVVLIQAFPTVFLPIIGFILVIVIASAVSGAMEKRKVKKENRLKLEAERRQRFEKREELIAGNLKPEYHSIPSVKSQKDDIYEEKLLKEAFNKYLIVKNESLRIEQHNHFVLSAKKEIIKINQELGYAENADVEKIPALLGQVSLSRTFVKDNFSLLYEHFFHTEEWKVFLLRASKVKSKDGKMLFLKNTDDASFHFFYGYDTNLIELDSNEFLYFFPCYVIKINVFEGILSVITHQEFVRNLFAIEKRCSYDEYIQFTKCYKKYLNVFRDKDNATFFEDNFSLNEEDKKKKFLRERNKIIAGIHLDTADESSCSEFAKKISNKEEFRMNKAFFDFLTSKNKIESIISYNTAIQETKVRLAELNRRLGYSEDKDADKLPKRKAVAKIKTIDDIDPGFEKLCSYFASKQDWVDFIGQLNMCITQDQSKLVMYDLDPIYLDFFANRNIPVIHLGEGLDLVLFPCYAVLIRENEFNIISYDRIKIKSVYRDEKKKTKNNKNGMVVRTEYLYQNKDGTPDKRRKINPLLYTARYYSVCFSVKNYKRTLPCVDAEKVEQLFENYSKVFLDETNAYVLKSVFKKEERVDIDLLVTEYRNNEKAKKEKAEKQKVLEEARRERERQAREEEARQKNLAIIQRQKEKNEERLRQKKIKENALKFFDVEEVTAENEQTTVTSAIVLTEVFSVLSKPVITNNIFKVELKQIGEMDCAKFDIVFVDMNESIISHKKTVEIAAVGQISTVGIVLLSNIDFTKIKKCFMWIIANGEVIEKKPFEMNISFYSDF